MNKMRFTCNDCGYAIEVNEEEFKMLNDDCPVCGNVLLRDLDYEQTQEPLGDNYPVIPYTKYLEGALNELAEIRDLKDQKKITQNDINDLIIDVELFCKDNTTILYKKREEQP
jgi:rRNA maturation endonuclease Nob1